MKDISERFLQGEARSLLCAPSYRGGAVDPLDFARRLIDSEKYGHEPSEHEKTLAILRLVPVSKREALESIDAEIENRTEYIEAVRFALGADDFDPVAEGTPQYWFAAARAREPFGDFPHLESLFPYHGPDAAFAAKYEAEKIEQTPKIIGHPYSIKIVPKPYGNPGHFPPTILHARLDDGWRWTFLEHPWKLSIWPLNPDPVFARAIERYSNVPDGAYGRSLTWYLSSFSPFMKDIGKISGMLLLMGLSAKLADIRTVARDTMIRLIGAGNLKIETCIDATVELVSSEAFKRVRWAAEFQILSGVSKRHAVFVRKLLEGIVPSIEPARCGGFLELLLELCISAEENVQSNVTRDYLSSIKGTGKSAKLAKQLLRNR